MKENYLLKWKALRDAAFLVSLLPEKPIAWGIGGSFAAGSPHPHDIDVCLLYEKQTEWMKDRKVWLEGWRIPFDLFFFTNFVSEDHKKWMVSELGEEWRGDIQDINPPKLKIKRELYY
jgi:hypothetical protein